MADVDTRQGKSVASSEILRYVNDLHAPHDAGLAAAYAAPATEGMPAINIGASEGRMLELLLRMIGASKVVEIGTLAGYSAIWMARGLEAGGQLWTIEYDARHAAVAKRNIETAGLGSVITVLVGSGLDVLPTLEPTGPFDAVFIDADKGNYDRYGQWALANLRKGGLLLGDNAYFMGNLLDERPEAGAMRRFHEEAHAALETVCLPTPDGMLLGIKR